MPVVEIFTDGSCVNATGAGGWAWVAVSRSHFSTEPEDYHLRQDDVVVAEGSRGARGVTNNQMELAAIYHGLSWLCHHPQEARLWTDSNYARFAVTEWVAGWLRNGWVTSTGQPVVNKERIMAVHKRLKFLHRAGYPVKVRTLKGHSGYYWNEYADQKAGEARRQSGV